EIMKLPISYEEKGIQKGKEIGKKEGEAQGVKKVAIEMLRNGLEVELIAKVTHMDVEEIKKVKEQLYIDESSGEVPGVPCMIHDNKNGAWSSERTANIRIFWQ